MSEGLPHVTQLLCRVNCWKQLMPRTKTRRAGAWCTSMYLRVGRVFMILVLTRLPPSHWKHSAAIFSTFFNPRPRMKLYDVIHILCRYYVGLCNVLLFCWFCCVFLFCPSFVANSQQDDEAYVTDGQMFAWSFEMFWSETSPGCFHVFRRFHHICAFVTVPVLKRQEDRMRNRLVLIDYFGRCSVHWILSGQAFIKHSETNANACGVRWCVGLRCLHSTCRFLVRKVSQITTANRPMCCRKPSRLKGNWDMFSIAISSYIF